MAKRVILLCISIVVIGSVIGMFCYTNTPEYIMKKYVKAVNSKDQKSLERIIYTANQLKVVDINEAYESGRAYNIQEYRFQGELDDPDPTTMIPLLLRYKYPEKMTDSIDRLQTFTIYGDDNNWDYDIKIGRVNGRWQVVWTPLTVYE